MSELKAPQNLRPILKPIYKRTHDGYYIMTNAPELTSLFRWRKIDDFLAYIEERCGAKIHYINGKYLLEPDISISTFNNFLIREYFKETTATAAGII